MSADRPKFFAILMPWGRVGSNLLVSALNATPKIKVENEPTTGLRSRGRAAGLTLEEINAQHHAHLDDFVANASADMAACGLKLAYRSLIDRSSYMERLAAHDVQLVLMTRANFLKCAVSQQRAFARVNQAGEKGLWSSAWGVTIDEPKPTAVPLDIEKTIQAAHAFEVLHYEMLGRVQSVVGTRYKHITYEALQADLEPTIQSVFTELGLQAPDDVVIRHRKATSDRLQDDIVNYDAFAKAVTDAGMGRYL